VPEKKPGILQHHPEQPAQVLSRVVDDISAVQRDFPFIHIVETHEELHHGSLASPRGAYDGHPHSRPYFRGKRADDRGVLGIAEFHAPEIDIPFNSGLLPSGAGIGFFLFLLQERENTFRRSGGLLKDIGDIGDLGHGLGEGSNVLDEGLHIAQGYRPGCGQIAAQDGHAHVAEVSHEIHHRHHDGGKELGFPRRMIEGIVEFIESGLIPGLPVERFHHAVAGEYFLYVPVHVA